MLKKKKEMAVGINALVIPVVSCSYNSLHWKLNEIVRLESESKENNDSITDKYSKRKTTIIYLL